MAKYQTMAAAPKISNSSLYFSSLPVPTRHFKSFSEYNEEVLTARVGRSSSSSSSGHRDLHSCPHPKSMIDEALNTCLDCGLWLGVNSSLAEGSSISFGAHYHAYTSATASATARKKRANAVIGIASSRDGTDNRKTVCVNPLAAHAAANGEGSHVYDQRHTTAARLLPILSIPTTIDEGADAEAFSKVFTDFVGVSAIPANIAIKLVGADARRAWAVAETAKRAFTDPHVSRRGGKTLPNMVCSGAFFLNSREPCPVAMAIVASRTVEKYPSEVTQENVHTITNELNGEILVEVENFVKENIDYFSMPQRRRLHAITLFVAILGCHIKIVHSSDISTATECLELDRVYSRVKPSQAKGVKRSFAATLGASLGVNSACITRLTREACDMFKKE